MLPAFKGRINRKTFILGNIIGLCALGFAGLIYIVPIAIIDIVVNGSNVSFLFKALYSLFFIPAVFYLFFFSVLFVRRLHDVGYPGMLILWAFIALPVISRLLDIWLLNIIAFFIILGVVLLPGQKSRNNFGQKPGKKFNTSSIAIKF